ncbi:MAG: OmpA family protein [Terrimonas ferruginea]|uniref:OmpA family protein n=1 Tax=Terrimonas ferruginea TaxID=249 RepID=UPI00086AFA02|nr:OmpA family protein [Terrimonas ferruginea]MBN8783397.1 OmpA family protein [Terrimonas ferruginea]ODS71904.1 MAG: flagellar motor protein MotB [Cytophagaceae bacterium SCN 52-12]OJW40172.1 MAG: flagellar motor protein MotB [Sphingobacteriales bacterium 48-107]
MKTLIISSFCLLISYMVTAQTKTREPGQWQVGVFGGGSQPLGTYKGDIGKARTGYTAGLFADKYFGGNHWGIGIDARYLQHGLPAFDSVFFGNGYIATTFNSPKSFRHMAFTLGPVYRTAVGSLEIEAFAKAGVMLQQFPNYTQTMTYTTPLTSGSIDIFSTANPKDDPKAWVGVGGLRFNYKLNDNWAIFLQGDYLSTISRRFSKDSSEYYVSYRPALKPLNANDIVDDPLAFYAEKPEYARTYTQAVNLTAGVKYIFGKKHEPVKPRPLPEVAEEVAKTPAPAPKKEEMKKDILVVVKDRQTGLALSGVRVDIAYEGNTFTSLTNANGEADRLKEATEGSYAAHGEKNGVATTTVLITPADFKQSGTVIYKEVFHDDPRFTLIGETVECASEQKLKNINTTLTNSGSHTNMSQVSDGEGKFIYQLDPATAYTIVANQAGKYSQTEQVTTEGLDRTKTLYVSLKLGVCNLQQGSTWVLKNILYDLDKSFIRSDAATVLDNVVNIMKQNPTLRIELSSHTDSRGSDAYNMSLSRRRAEAAVNYLVSKGVEKNRLTARGYGETKPLNECVNGINCSEDQHQQNRRTEIKVLSY